jgi:5-methylcytosine-specific restriction protein B
MDAEVLDELETEQNIVSRFRKNDFGRGGAWPFLWVAAYPRGGSRVVGPQLFIRVEAGVLRYGLFVSASDRESLQRLRERAAQPAFRERFDALADLDLDVRPGEQADPLTIAEWLDAPAGESVSIARSLSTEAARTVPADQLAQQIADAFTALSSIYQLATKAAIDPAEPITAPNPTYTLAEMSRETGFAEEELQSWADAVDRKGQAILYGPPGTGKTYVAHRLARHLVSGGGGTIQAIQFHPAFAYEDFIQGLRPVVRDDGSLGYQVLPGRFLEFCEKARGRDGASVLIIDEINRADLARVFGELMYLLEYRDQAIPLAAGGKPFKIPGNVRIIGTMNTADRSIALVDHALRRRFAFLRLTPRYDVLEEFHDASDFPAAALHELLQRINRQIGDPSYWLGISYFLVEDLDEDLLQTIWQQEIEPYLEELFFDQPDRMEKLRWSHVAPEIFA